MSITVEQLHAWMLQPEDEHLEFKEAKQRFDFEKLVRLCAAMANEGGGQIILGVTDKRPRRVVGTHAFPDVERTRSGLIERLQIRITTHLVPHLDGDVLVFSIPSRLPGVPIEYRGAYWMRGGEDTVPMTPDQLRAIFDETTPDFSAQVCPSATIEDLDPRAIAAFRAAWHEKAKNPTILHCSNDQLLADAELTVDGGITYAALVLLGSRQGLGRHLAQAEVIFEYRNRESSIPSQHRQEYREGFFLFQDELWNVISLRNEVTQAQEGFFRRDILAFSEATVREAVLNAISHRDYRLIGSTFIRQYPQKLEVVSPGGFPKGITVDTILWNQVPRNRRIAEALTRTGLIERSGQGVNLMFESSIREGKRPPDYSGTDANQVFLTLRGEVQDVRFVRFLEQISSETLETFTTEDYLILDAIHREEPVSETLKPRLTRLRDLGIIETHGRGKGMRHMLSRRFYGFVGQPGTYTNRLGLDRETNKMLLLKHIESYADSGCQLAELTQVLPGLAPKAVQRLLGELRAEQRIHLVGITRNARWYPGPSVEP